MVEPVFIVIDRHSPSAIKLEIARLVGSELGGERSADEILRTIGFDERDSKILGVMVDQELVSINAFMPLDFRRGTTPLVGVQSGFSATDSRHRGKGYWPRLMQFAEQYLVEQKVAFIFGFPNPTSHPLFVHKLKYTEFEFHNFKIPSFPPLMGATLRATRSAEGEALVPDFDDNRRWKEGSGGGDRIVSAETVSGRIWGKLRRRSKLGIAFTYLEVGSLEVAPGGSLKDLFASVARVAGVAALYLSINPENAYYPLLRGGRFGQPLIVRPLGDFDLSGGPLNFFGGMRDTF